MSTCYILEQEEDCLDYSGHLGRLVLSILIVLSIVDVLLGVEVCML